MEPGEFSVPAGRTAGRNERGSLRAPLGAEKSQRRWARVDGEQSVQVPRSGAALSTAAAGSTANDAGRSLHLGLASNLDREPLGGYTIAGTRS